MHVSVVMQVLHELRFMKPTAKYFQQVVQTLSHGRWDIHKKCRKPLRQAVKMQTMKNQCATKAVPRFTPKNTTFPLVMHACDSKHLSRGFCLCFRLRRHTCFLDLAT